MRGRSEENACTGAGHRNAQWLSNATAAWAAAVAALCCSMSLSRAVTRFSWRPRDSARRA